MDAISRGLILWHHDFVLHDPQPAPRGFTIEEGQVWYLPSYHVTRGTEIFDCIKKPASACQTAVRAGVLQQRAITGTTASRDRVYTIRKLHPDCPLQSQLG